MNQLQDDQLVFIFVDNGYEVQAGIPLVVDFILFVLDKVTHFGFAGDN